jgi:hypothetical protein
MENTRGDLIATEAERAINEVRQTGPDDVDDGAFMSLLLARFAPAELAEIPKRHGERHPNGTEFYEFFATHPRKGWERVAKLAEARAGDIIVWKDTRSGHGHGHVAALARAPEHDQKARVWTVHVHDSSSEAHFEDSRRQRGRFHPGLGSGALKLRVDSNGVPAAVQVGPDSEFHKLSIAIARLEDQALVKETRSKSRAPDPAAPFGHRIERGAVANENLQDGEFAITTYALASSDGLLLPPTTLAYWGPGQKISQSVGKGVATYGFVGGVVFRNC